MHAPPSHCCPATQAGPLPHLHEPPAQLSARESHAMHTPPSPPHRAAVGTLHVSPVQQPPGQESGLQPSQAPPSQCCPAGHAEHVDPAEPHERSVRPSSQTSPLQHPVGHELAVHLHASATHSRPEPHDAVHAPHAPPEHVSTFWHPPSQVRVMPSVHTGPASTAAPPAPPPPPPAPPMPASRTTHVPRMHKKPTSQSALTKHGLPVLLLHCTSAATQTTPKLPQTMRCDMWKPPPTRAHSTPP